MARERCQSTNDIVTCLQAIADQLHACGKIDNSAVDMAIVATLKRLVPQNC